MLTSAYEIHLPLPYPVVDQIIYIYFILFYSRLNRTIHHPPGRPRYTPPLRRAWSHGSLPAPLMLALVFSCCGLRPRPHDPVSPLSPRLPRSPPPSQTNALHSFPTPMTPQREYPLILPLPLTPPPLQPTAPRDRPPKAQGASRLRCPFQRRVCRSTLFHPSYPQPPTGRWSMSMRSSHLT